MEDSFLKSKFKEIRNISLWSFFLNLSLMVLKLISGVLINSSALIADGVHSLSDLFTDITTLIGAKLSNRPADCTHPYGHGKLETISSLVVALFLLGISGGIIWSAGVSLYRHQSHYPGFMMLVIAGISLLAKELIFLFSIKIAQKYHSSVLRANAWHHRSDSLSSGAVLLGGIAGVLGWGYGDQVAAMGVGVMIIWVGCKILKDGLFELTEHSADEESIQEIEKVLKKDKEIKSWHALRTRKVGSRLIVDVHILVASNLSVSRSHQITTRIEEKIRERFTNPSNILVHVEPCSNSRENN